jgi:hypothetical protein
VYLTLGLPNQWGHLGWEQGEHLEILAWRVDMVTHTVIPATLEEEEGGLQGEARLDKSIRPESLCENLKKK